MEHRNVHPVRNGDAPIAWTTYHHRRLHDDFQASRHGLASTGTPGRDRMREARAIAKLEALIGKD